MTTESEKLQNDLEPINSWEYKNYLMKHKLLQIEKTLKIIDQILNGENPKPGSYRGRLNSEPENNRKTLMDIKNA